MITKFIYKEKELCFVTFFPPIDNGDIVEYDDFGRNIVPSRDHVYPQYQVTGRKLRISPVFGGELFIYLNKI
jgi:hypothetical protein